MNLGFRSVGSDDQLAGWSCTTNKYDIIEFLQWLGSGAPTCPNLLGYTTVAMDWTYDTSAPPPKAKKKARSRCANSRSAMDLNSSAGFVLLFF